MSIEPTAALAPAAIQIERPPSQPAVSERAPAAQDQSLTPNPRIEFDPKLRLVVYEFHNETNNTVTRYPDSATANAANATTGGGGHDITA